MRIRPLYVVVIVAVVAAVAFYLSRPEADAFGPQLAYCPGPDNYGYTCESATTFAYIPGEVDTGLYLDDGVVSVPLPFPFRFYGQTYEQVTASSNGNLQFGSGNPDFASKCVDERVAVGMGELVAAYWDDLDLTAAGFLLTAVAGEAPERIFVVEWQGVPRFGGALDDTVTFAVQLHEGSDDIVILHQDVTTDRAANGRRALVGLQSERNAISLTFSCRQAAVADPGGIRFAHPERANETDAAAPTQPAVSSMSPKGDVATLMARLTAEGRAALPGLNRVWHTAPRPRIATWEWLEEGDERLAILWREPGDRAAGARLALIEAPLSGTPALLLDEPLAGRDVLKLHPVVLATGDIAGGTAVDVIIHDRLTGRHWLAADGIAGWRLVALPEHCRRSDLSGILRGNAGVATCNLAGIRRHFELAGFER